MSYRMEFRAHWRPLLAATVGMSLGLALNHYVMSLFAPAIIAEFGWSRAQYALIGIAPFVTMFFIPLAGRFTDRVGPRIAATVGFVSLPLGYLALSFMNGSFYLFLAILIVKATFGTLTTTMVFARVVVERFDRARGIGLSIVMSGAPLVAAVAVPFVAEIIADYGWRNGFRALGLLSILGGVITVILLGRGKGAAPVVSERHVAYSRNDVVQLFRSPLFLLTIGGMLLVNVPQLLVASQLKLVLAENGASGAAATGIIALYAGGVAVGRFISGLALDRIAVHKVAIFALGLPALGLAALASPFDAVWLLGGSVLLMALAQGAEGDIGAYLVSRKFALRNYSLILSFLTVSLTLGAATGPLILSYTLRLADRYDSFLLISAGATLVGAVLFYLTGKHPGEREVAPALGRPALA
ncbi:MFS transporter [Sphingomonas solaris]|uniref:MFS transporter n=1 Tax=Alterirhizorhabdus solaris TaxID=2529389 RepID=A0A558RB24_9SPHN|nr:MFS transporter [Sphingomonas solaris]TVV76617.1 MFS transporter [Sphingomonas solaris]